MTHDDPVPISSLEHYCYCPRQSAMILIDHDWLDNRATTRGSLGHRRADTPGHKTGRGRNVVRAVPLWSTRWRLTGRADTVEIDTDGNLHPVEYKIGHPHGDTAHVQVCAQALCLEEMTGTDVTTGAIWYAGPRRRVDVIFDDTLRRRTIGVIEAVHEMKQAGRLPTAVNDHRCTTCQLEPRCLPSVSGGTQRVANYIRRELYECRS